MLSVVMVSVIMLSVAAPSGHSEKEQKVKEKLEREFTRGMRIKKKAHKENDIFNLLETTNVNKWNSTL